MAHRKQRPSIASMPAGELPQNVLRWRRRRQRLHRQQRRRRGRPMTHREQSPSIHLRPSDLKSVQEENRISASNTC